MSGHPVVDPPASARGVRIIDGTLIAIVLTFAGWVTIRPSGAGVNALLDYLTFSVMGMVVAILQHHASRVSIPVREQRAWQLLAMSSVLRVLSGIVWSLWIVDHPGENRPLWLLAVSAVSLLLGIGGLAAFGRESRQDVGRRRQGIDGVIVLVGVVTALWFAALGPVFAATGAQEPRLEDYVYLLVDFTGLVLAALLVLSRAQRYLRHATSLLLLAALLQLVPDVLLWAGKANYS